MHKLFNKILHAIIDKNPSNLSDNVKDILCELIDCNCEKLNNSEESLESTTIDYYFLTSDVSKNKSLISIYSTDGTQRQDFINNTIYKLYKKEDDSLIGEIAAFYNKIISYDNNYYHYSIIGNATILDNIVGLPSGSCVFNIKDKRFTFPNISVETTDYKGNRVVIKKLTDDITTPDRVYYRAVFFKNKV